jgi:hypothetical protein
MAKYTVTWTRKVSIEVEARDAGVAEDAARVAAAERFTHAENSYTAERIHAEFEYRVRITQDPEPYMVGDAEDEDAVNADIERYGVVGFIAERRPVDTEDGEPGEWEHVDSCWGFIAAPGWETHMRDYLSKEFLGCDFE